MSRPIRMALLMAPCVIPNKAAASLCPSQRAKSVMCIRFMGVISVALHARILPMAFLKVNAIGICSYITDGNTIQG